MTYPKSEGWEQIGDDEVVVKKWRITLYEWIVLFGFPLGLVLGAIFL